MAKSSKTKKKSPPANRKRSPKNNRKPSLLPPLFFLLTVCSLIAIFYTYNNFATLNQKPFSKSVNTSDYPAKKTPTQSPDSKQLKKRSHLSSQPIKINYFRLDKNYSQARQHTIKFEQSLNQQQKAWQIIHLLSFSREADLPPLPAKTKLLRAEFTPPLITLDISRDLTNGAVNFGARDEMMALSCLTNTFLLNFPSNKYVQILIEGQIKETLAGHIDISKPLSYQPSIND